MKLRGDYQEMANRIRTDMDGRGPRLRLSVVGYLTDANVTPKTVGSVDEWLDLVKKTVTFVSEDMEGYANMVEALEPPEEGEEVEGGEVKDAYAIRKGSGGAYL